MKKLDLLGKVFGRLQVVSHLPSKKTDGGNSVTQWQCKCDCGQFVSVSTTHLTKGHTQSCGCRAIDVQRTVNVTHSMSGTRTYRSWRAMINRCTNTKLAAYGRYGGRGITVTERWLSFENFHQDMGDRPEGKTLDRINNDGNYEPKNCRWATIKEQNSNKRPRKDSRISKS